MQVMLHYNGEERIAFVHQLVMSAHCPNPNPEIYTDINHIDEDKTNNRLDNLEWTTHKENCNHGTAIERHAQKLRDKFIPIIQLDFDGNIVNVYYKAEIINNTGRFIAYKINESISKERYIYKNYFWIKLDEYNNLQRNELLNLINTKIKLYDRHKTSNKPIMQFLRVGLL